MSTLNNLIEICRKGQAEFRKAADSVQNSEFRRLFNIFHQQRTQFITELQTELNRIGGESESARETKLSNTIPFVSSAERKNMANRDEASVVAACQSEEEAAVNDYQEALKGDLPLDVQYVVKRQYMDIKDAYDRIRILQRAA